MGVNFEHQTVEYIVTVRASAGATLSHEHETPDTEFMTTPDLNMQVGFIKYPEGGAIQPHVHLPIERASGGDGRGCCCPEGQDGKC